MKFFGSLSTDTGIVKKTNQDSSCLKIAEIKDYGQVAMVIICDGMGGLSKGELASATVIRQFEMWFERELPKRIKNYTWESFSDEWTKILRELNHKILEYGKKTEDSLGTTVCAFLAIDDKYMIVNVGDSRAYEISDSLKQITKDQTFVRREIDAGRMTEEEAKTHPKRNMLLQCVGASREVNPDFTFGTINSGSVYMLCSDGFRHVIGNDEIYNQFMPSILTSVETMKKNSDGLIDVVKKKNERDNITVALIKCVE